MEGWSARLRAVDCIMQIAYTIGSEVVYDAPRAPEDTLYKSGCQLDPPYQGGWVWRSEAAARAFLKSRDFGFAMAVYELDLPSGWDADVSPLPDPVTGAHHLIHDARITRKLLPSLYY